MKSLIYIYVRPTLSFFLGVGDGVAAESKLNTTGEGGEKKIFLVSFSFLPLRGIASFGLMLLKGVLPGCSPVLLCCSYLPASPAAPPPDR